MARVAKVERVPARTKANKPRSLTKRQLASELLEIANAGGAVFTTKEILLLLDALSETVENVVAEAGVIDIPGVCRIAVRVRNAGKGRNPATGEPIKIAAKATVRATPKPNVKRSVPSVQKARRILGS
jgi:DNA-binding protein HU-beta